MFLIQSVKDGHRMGIEVVLWKELLKEKEYKEISIEDIDSLKVNDPIPLGSLEFTQKVLERFYHIDIMNPIEVPICLRTNEFLKRKYKICKWQDIPDGYWFIKNVSSLKLFASVERVDKTILDKKALYQVSEPIDIKAEYRIYVLHGEIYAVAYYNGEPHIFPDMALINKANYIYSQQNDYPRSYTMDVAITDKGTCIIECHVMLACGLYTTVLGKGFMSGYQDGIDYLLKHNTKIEEFSNFGD